jgi:hypothetical protein
VTNDPIAEMRRFLVEAVQESPDIERQAEDLMGDFAGRIAGLIAKPLAAGEGPTDALTLG